MQQIRLCLEFFSRPPWELTALPQTLNYIFKVLLLKRRDKRKKEKKKGIRRGEKKR